MRILVLGAGAMGGYFGGRLSEAGADVTFLVRPRRQQQLVNDGLVIESPCGDIRKAVATVTAEDPGNGYDVVLLTCKAYDLDDALTAIAPAVGPATLVLPILNGLSHLDRLDASFGAARVLGGLAQITATLTADGTIRHLSPLHRFVFGTRSPEQAEPTAKLAETVGKAKFDGVQSQAIIQEMWEKHAFIATLAGATCLMRATVGDILANPGGDALILGIRDEAAAIAAANAHPLRPNAKAGGEKLLVDRRSTMAASMLRDLEGGHRTEADHVIGDLIRRGATHGIAAPLLSLAYLHLQASVSWQVREHAAA